MSNAEEQTGVSLLGHVTALIAANNQRYEQKFSDNKTAVDAAFAAQKELVQTAIANADKAVAKAEASAEKRFDAVNEFRGTLADQQRTLMPRSEAEVIFREIKDRLDRVQISATERKSEGVGIGAGLGYAFGIIGSLIGIASVIAALLALKH